MQDGHNGWTQVQQIKSREEERGGNLAFQIIISSFPAVSAHLIIDMLLQQCIPLPCSSTFNAKAGVILTLKHLVSARCTPPFLLCFCTPARMSNPRAKEKYFHTAVQMKKLQYICCLVFSLVITFQTVGKTLVSGSEIMLRNNKCVQSWKNQEQVYQGIF